MMFGRGREQAPGSSTPTGCKVSGSTIFTLIPGKGWPMLPRFARLPERRRAKIDGVHGDRRRTLGAAVPFVRGIPSDLRKLVKCGRQFLAPAITKRKLPKSSGCSARVAFKNVAVAEACDRSTC